MSGISSIFSQLLTQILHMTGKTNKYIALLPLPLKVGVPVSLDEKAQTRKYVI